MKIVVFVLMFLLLSLPAFPQDAGQAVLTQATDGWGLLIWNLANSPLGVSIIMGLVAWAISRVLTAKPRAVELFLQYKPLFIDAVRAGEKAIPDGSTGAAGKADAALKYLLNLADSPLAKAKEADLRKALDLAHAAEQKKLQGNSGA